MKLRNSADKDSQKNLIEFAKNAKIGEALNSRGGYGYSYEQLTFIKTGKNKVHLYINGNWSSNIDNATYKPIAKITPEYLQILDVGWRSTAIFSIGNFDSNGAKLLPVKPYYRYHDNFVACLNGNFVYENNMKIDWEGNCVNITARQQKRTDNAIERVRQTVNAKARARYKQAKADREYRKYSDGKFPDWNVSNTLFIKNAQVRQMAIEEIGLDKVLAKFPTEVIDSDIVDGRSYELVQISINGLPHQPYHTTVATYLKMINPSTGEYHLEGIPTKDDNSWDYCPEPTVICALAWRDGEVTIEKNWDKSPVEDIVKWKYTKPEVLT
ncbi:MAG: hypothetical protein GOVbin2066_21 [Prokaryotic dsDNA virus sp.]|nr:MAG: hypothetical protein GOVbin2066_21 [Prokaryotic dsDNA virus sp.]|tara:strand:+ start:30618 stop:31595 length:978 start_codon:yes stop_codon:yes gene_type:complete